jgi:hypothetical protein
VSSEHSLRLIPVLLGSPDLNFRWLSNIHESPFGFRTHAAWLSQRWPLFKRKATQLLLEIGSFNFSLLTAFRPPNLGAGRLPWLSPLEREW